MTTVTGIITDVEATVVDIDFRDRYEDLVEFGPFTELQRAFTRSLGVGENDPSRVLIIDDARDLEQHTAGIEKIVGAKSVEKVVCLVVGPPHDELGRGYAGRERQTRNSGRQRLALRKPFVLRAPHVTLWVSDARGVGWEMNQAQSQTLTEGDSPNNGPLLDALVDALRIPRVFDQVYEIVGRLPDGVAAPGLRAMSGRADNDLLGDAQVRAVDRMLAPRHTNDLPPVDLVAEPFTLMLRYPRTPGASESVLIDGGPVESRFRTCRLLLDAASASVATVTSRGAILRRGITGVAGERSHAATVTLNVRAVGSTLGELRRDLDRLFEEYDSRRPLGTTQTRKLRAHGFELIRPNSTDRRNLVAALRHLVEGALAADHPVTEIRGWLGRMHDALVPTGSAARIDDLRAACSERELERLRGMTPLSITLTSPWAWIPVVLACLLAGFATGSELAGPLAALLAIAAATAGGWRLAAARRTNPYEKSPFDLFLLFVLAVLAGTVGVGFVVSGAAEPVLLPPVQAGAAVLAVFLLLCWPQWVWSAAVRRWRPGRTVATARAQVEALYDLMVDVARYDWQLTAARRSAADLVRAMSTAFADISTAMDRHADNLRGFPADYRRVGADGVDTEVADLLRVHSPDISQVVGEDVVSAVTAVVEQCWPDIERDAMDALKHWVTEATTSTLDTYTRHLDRIGVHSPPPFGILTDARRCLIDAVWRESRKVAGMLTATVTDPGILQLCAPEHLQLLDVDPATARVVRFAPKAAQPSLSKGGPGGRASALDSLPHPSNLLGDVVWTEWGQVAGVMRLARLRPGTVESVIEEAR